MMNFYFEFLLIIMYTYRNILHINSCVLISIRHTLDTNMNGHNLDIKLQCALLSKIAML